MKRILFLLTLCLTGWATTSHAQDAQRQAIQAICQPGSTVGWMELKEEVNLSHEAFFKEAKTALQLADHDEFILKKSNTDDLGISHFRYEQFAHGYRVHGAEYFLHELDERVYVANGKLATNLENPELVTMTEEEALARALKAVPSQKYHWHNHRLEKLHREKCNDPHATFFPEGELIWLRRNAGGDFTADNLRLAWVFKIHTTDGHSSKVFLDAYTGDFIKRFALDHDCDPGTGQTIFNGNVNINTSMDGDNFILLDDCQDVEIHLLDADDSTVGSATNEFVDADNVWNNQPGAVQTFFGLRQTWQFFANAPYNRDSYDDAGSDLIAHNAPNFNNARWSSGSEIMIFGDANTANLNDDLNTVDIVGHEFVHGVTQFSADLEYELESGALNESFSDIFGEMVELFTFGTNDWQMGGERGAIRNFIDPSLNNQPATYGDNDPNWFNLDGCVPDCSAGGNDCCGVHINSGVQNFWFYLLSVGGEGVNANGDYYFVEGIGTASASQIAYRNLTTYLGINSNFADAKDGAIQSAEDLFGSCSNEVLQCARAWNAVGVYASDVLGYDILVNCTALDLIHNAGIELNYVAFNDIQSDCDILPNGTHVDFQAGHAVILRPGFESGDDFRAHIESCTDAMGLGSRSSNGESAYTPPVYTKREKELKITAFPSPFTNRLWVNYHLPNESLVSLGLYDVRGNLIRSITNEQTQTKGEHRLDLDMEDLSPGIYVLRALLGEEVKTIRLVKAR